MNRFHVLAVLVAGSLPFTVGCATKNYVRNESRPLINKVNELDDLTAKNTRDIQESTARAAGHPAGEPKASSRSEGAGRRTDRRPGQQNATQAANRVTSLAGTVENLDNYKQVSDATVLFGFDKAELTRKDKQTLDDFAQQIQRPEALHHSGGRLHGFDRPG